MALTSRLQKVVQTEDASSGNRPIKLHLCALLTRNNIAEVVLLAFKFQEVILQPVWCNIYLMWKVYICLYFH